LFSMAYFLIIPEKYYNLINFGNFLVKI